MAKRTYSQKADLICGRVDKDPNDTTFKNFVIDCLVLTLQEIIAQVPYARWLLDEDSLTTASGTQYVAVPSDMDIDNIVSLRDETNNYQAVRITPQEADMIDPGRDMTGLQWMWWFQRVGAEDRIYFINRPDAVRTIKAIFGNIITDPTSAQTSALPAKYESIEIDGALIKVWERIDPDYNTDRIQRRYEGGYSEAGEPSGLCRIVHDARKASGQADSLYGHRPSTGGRPFGPSWPADYNILP